MRKLDRDSPEPYETMWLDESGSNRFVANIVARRLWLATVDAASYDELKFGTLPCAPKYRTLCLLPIERINRIESPAASPKVTIFYRPDGFARFLTRGQFVSFRFRCSTLGQRKKFLEMAHHAFEPILIFEKEDRRDRERPIAFAILIVGGVLAYALTSLAGDSGAASATSRGSNQWLWSILTATLTHAGPTMTCITLVGLWVAVALFFWHRFRTPRIVHLLRRSELLNT